MDNIKYKVYEIISEFLNIPVNQINDNDSQDTIEEWDSLKQMNIVIAIEEEFKITFDDSQVEEMLNVSLIIYFLKENLNKANN